MYYFPSQKTEGDHPDKSLVRWYVFKVGSGKPVAGAFTTQGEAAAAAIRKNIELVIELMQQAEKLSKERDAQSQNQAEKIQQQLEQQIRQLRELIEELEGLVEKPRVNKRPRDDGYWSGCCHNSDRVCCQVKPPGKQGSSVVSQFAG